MPSDRQRPESNDPALTSIDLDSAGARRASDGAAGPLAAQISAPMLQRKLQRRARERAEAGESTGDVQSIAAQGVSGASQSLPHGAAIQGAFGHHDVSGIRAHLGPAASGAAASIGAEAYATGTDVAFAGTPSLHTAAHEAAHVVQQRAGVHLAGGVGQAGDPYEAHADAVADRVVAGQSAAALLDAAPAGSGTAGVQRKDITDATPKEHQDAHAAADMAGGNALGSKMDLLSRTMKSIGADVDRVLKGPSNDGGKAVRVSILQPEFDRISADAEDLAYAAQMMQSLGGSMKNILHGSLAVLSYAFDEYRVACGRALDALKSDGLNADPDKVERQVNGTFEALGEKRKDFTPRAGSSAVDGKTVEALENEALTDSLTAMNACVRAVRMNVKSSPDAELSGDMSKLYMAMLEVRRLLKPDASHRFKKMLGPLKEALKEIPLMRAELAAAKPELGKRFENNQGFVVTELEGLAKSEASK